MDAVNCVDKKKDYPKKHCLLGIAFVYLLLAIKPSVACLHF